MLKIFFSLFLFIAVSSGLISQEIKPLENITELETILNDHNGKVTFVNLWATWCMPCVKEFPDIMKLYDNYKDKGFRIIFISLDDPADIDGKVMGFLVKHKVDFTTYYNKSIKDEDLINFIDKDYGGAIPYSKIYDREGKLKQSILGNRSYEFFEAEVTKLLE